MKAQLHTFTTHDRHFGSSDRHVLGIIPRTLSPAEQRAFDRAIDIPHTATVVRRLDGALWAFGGFSSSVLRRAVPVRAVRGKRS